MLKPPESEILPTRTIEKEGLNVMEKMRIIASEIVKLNQIDMRGSTHEVDRYSQYQLPPGRAQSTFLLLHQRCCGGKVLLRYFLTEKVTKR